jgi:urea transport system ATP-binding protein
MNTNRPNVLEVEGLGVSFDGFKAVDGFNFYLAQNHVHVIIGPNGAGKTTVLDLICGKTSPHRAPSNSREGSSAVGRNTRSSAMASAGSSRIPRSTRI